MHNVAEGSERADDRQVRRSLCLLVAILLAVATIGVLAGFMAGDTMAPSLRFFAQDFKRVAWQLGLPLLLVLARREWGAAFGLSPRRLPTGLRAFWLYGPILFCVVLTLNFLYGRYCEYDSLLSVTLANCTYYFLFNALAEELFFRGMVQSALIRLLRNPALGLVLA
ncbi:MAG: CPBP family glutamic-type intramembrane protease, partial [Planctomycetota bacterium]